MRAVAAYRTAARRGTTAGVPLRRRLLVLLALAARARAEADPTVRSWAEQVVSEESRPLLEDDVADGPGDAWERAQRRLRARAYVVCPECLSPLATDLRLEQLARRRCERIADLERRAGAAATTAASAEDLEAAP